MNKKLATFGVSLGLAGAAAGLTLGHPSMSGAVGSASTAATTSTTAGTASTAATAAGSTTDARPDPSARLTEVLTPLVTDGTLTQAQLDAVVAKLAAAGPIGGGGGRHGHRGGPGLAAAATALGVTEAELRTSLQSGSTIADVATSKGVALQTVVDAMVAEENTEIDAKVTDGSLTQAEADTRKADVVTRVTAMVNGQMPAGGPRGDHDGDGPGAPPAAGSSSTGATGSSTTTG